MADLLSASKPVHIRCGAYDAMVAPAAGGRLLSLHCSHNGQRVPLLVEAGPVDFDAHHWPKAGAFPMLPFANRLPAQGFLFQGRAVRPEAGPRGFALHGSAHRRRWDVVSVAAGSVVMRCGAAAGEHGWPWAWSAEQEVRVSAQGATVTLSVRNDSDEPMPVGIGWHPYHPWPRDGEFTLQALARHELDAEGRARGGEQGVPRTVDPGGTIACSGWQGTLQMAMAGGTLHVECEGATALVLHRPARGDYLCVEPVTLLPGHLGEDDAVLLPGESRRLSWTCRLLAKHERR